MATNNKNNERIWTIACLDGSKYSTAVRDYALWLSQSLKSPFKALHAIEHNANASVADLTGAIGLGAQEQLLAELTELEQQRNKLEIQKGRQMLESVKAYVEQQGIENPMLVQRHGSLIESLIDLEDDARVVVVGIRGELHEDNVAHLGAHLESIVRSVQRPIFVVNREFTAPKAAMLAYDGSACCMKGLEMVKTSPLFNNLPIHVVHVASEEGKAQSLVNYAKQALEEAGRMVQTEILTGQPHEALCQYQREHHIDLTVMGAFSHNRLRELVFGSFTIKMLLNTDKPLLLLR